MFIIYNESEKNNIGIEELIQNIPVLGLGIVVLRCLI